MELPKMSRIDRAIAFVSPQWALQRMHAKTRLTQFGYNDRPWERGRSGGMSRNADSENWRKHRERIDAMWDARDLCEYTWIGGVLGRLVRSYVLNRLSCKSQTGDPAIDAAYDEFFHNWCGDELDEQGRTACDLTGRYRFLKLMQMATLGMMVDGDYGFVLRMEEAGMKLQGIESDRLGSPTDGNQDDLYIGGITIDEATGSPIEYRIYRRNRKGLYDQPEGIEPARFIHILDPDRSDTYRGKTWLMRMLEDTRHLRESFQAELFAIKTQGQYAAFVNTKDPTNGRGAGAFNGTPTKEGGTKTQEAVFGKILTLSENEQVNFTAPSPRPSGSTQAFWDTVVRTMAHSLRLSYGFVWNLASLGGVSQRVEVRSDERTIEGIQNMLASGPLRRIRRAVLDYGVAIGALPPHPNLAKCAWHFGARIVTDAGYEASNDIAMARSGFVSWDSVAAKYSDGDSLRDVHSANASAVNGAREVAAEKGVPIEVFAPDLMPSATAQIAAMETDPAETTPPPGSQAALGDKGASQVLDMLAKVTQGQMDRAAAVNTLVITYGYPPEMAEKVVPQPAPEPQEPAQKDDSKQ